MNKTFQFKLPAIKYRVTYTDATELAELKDFLHKYTCMCDDREIPQYTEEPQEVTQGMLTVYCGGCYDYNTGSHGNPSSVLNVVQFKSLVNRIMGN